MDKVYLLYEDKEWEVDTLEHLEKNLWCATIHDNNGTKLHCIISVPIWTLKKKHPSLYDILSSSYKVLEVQVENNDTT